MPPGIGTKLYPIVIKHCLENTSAIEDAAPPNALYIITGTRICDALCRKFHRNAAARTRLLEDMRSAQHL